MIVRLHVFAVLLVACDSFAADDLWLDLSVDLSKTPRKKEYFYEYVDDQEVNSEKDIEQYVISEVFTLDMTVANRTKQDSSITLEWFFIAESIRGEDGSYRDELRLAASGKESITVEATNSVQKAVSYKFILNENFTTGTYEIRRDPITGEFPDFAPQGGTGTWTYDSRVGEKYAGYVVLLSVDGRIIAKDSNSSRFLKEKWIAQFRNPPAQKRPAPKTDWRNLYNRWW